jgi:hypothetical protein
MGLLEPEPQRFCCGCTARLGVGAGIYVHQTRIEHEVVGTAERHGSGGSKLTS